MQVTLWASFIIAVNVNGGSTSTLAVKQAISPCVSRLFSRFRSMMFSFVIRRRLLRWSVISLLVAFAYISFPRTAINPSLFQCTALSLALPKKVAYPSSTTYSSSSSSYWSTQEESLSPSCIVTPISPTDVVTVIKTLNLLNKGGSGCKFAVRGGGHTPWAGSANINGGVTIDMRSVSDVSISADRSVASVGAGAIWGDVYRRMDALNLTVVGGRGSSIGIGGLLTGGKF